MYRNYVKTSEGQITMGECKKILETFQHNKFPGNDRIPVVVYKNCWDLICELFIKCVDESFVKEGMSNSQKQTVITLNPDLVQSRTK